MPDKGKAGLAEQIRSIRLELGLTQEQFAAKVGVTFSTVNRWENGKGNPSPLANRQLDELRRGLNRSKVESTGRREK